MATDKINNYAIGDNNFESVMLTLDQTFRNKHDCYSFSATALKAGSVIEINGSLYPVTQDVTLPDMSSNKYLMAVPASDGTFTLLATSTAPTWSDSKQGFYGTSTTANYKYIAVLESAVLYKYNDRPFYVGAIYADALNMSGNITTAGDISCDDISCDDISCDDITALDVISSTSSYTTYFPTTLVTVTIKKSTMVVVPPGGSIEIVGASNITIISGESNVKTIALNPAQYRFGSLYTYTFIGAANTTTIGNIF